MVKGILLFVIVIVAAMFLAGCETAKGIKGDAQFIGDKTYEVIDK